MASKKSYPVIRSDKPWQDGTLSRVTASGTPGEPIVNLISREFPKALRDIVFTRSHISLWDSPIKVSDKQYLKVVGLEWINTIDEISDVCLIHLEAGNDNSDLETVSTYIEAVTRTWRKESQQFMSDLFIEQDLIHSELAQGLAVIGFQQQVIGSATETRGHVIAYSTTASEPKLIHAYGAHVLAVVALQQFALEMLNLIWPQNVSNRNELNNFSKKLLEFRHNFNWSSLFINPDARRLYRNLRESLGIEKRYADFGAEINEALTLSQSKTSLILTRVAAIVAISALIPVWIPNLVAQGEIGALGLVSTFVLMFVAFRSK